jgi:aldose 1-epimerase
VTRSYANGVTYPSGEQFEITAGGTSAWITEAGATLRAFVVDGRDVLWGFPKEEMTSAGRGQVLAPWPNRLADGAYQFNGRRGKASLDEPERRNAIHGLVRWRPFEFERRSASEVGCTCRLAAEPAYPWWVAVEVDYSVTPASLTVRTTATNLNDAPAPFALGFHPYFASPSGKADDLTLSLPASIKLTLDERGLPIGSTPIAGSPLEALHGGLTLAGKRFDDDFTGLDCSDGRWRARIEMSDAAPLTVWADETFRHVMVFTADTLAPPDTRRALALEPMTSPPNALASGEDLIVLEPGVPLVASWGVEVASPRAGV